MNCVFYSLCRKTRLLITAKKSYARGIERDFAILVERILVYSLAKKNVARFFVLRARSGLLILIVIKSFVLIVEGNMLTFVNQRMFESVRKRTFKTFESVRKRVK